VPAIAFYISGHGFGHSSRQIEIINALGPRLPEGWRIVVRTAAARWLFDRTLRARVTFLPGECDSGIAQVDSLRLDEAETVRTAAEFYGTFAARTAAETTLLVGHDARLVVADAPPLACAAAAAAALPAVVVGNFTWDWIYEEYEPRFEADAPYVLPAIRAAYARASAGWRLPMHGGFAAVPQVTDIPFVARHATRSRAKVLDALQIPDSRPLALFSFGGYGLDGLDLSTLDCTDAWTVVVTGPTPPAPALPPGVAYVNEGYLYDRGLRYEDLVAAVDVVVTKPGYGIISECVANRTAILYTSRGRFREYDVMVAEMPRVVRCAHLDQETLLAGRWQAALDALLASPPPPERPDTNGAEIVAADLLEHASHA
jgi:L-arabinokinase